MKNTHIITISGPSLSGKTEITKILKNNYGFSTVISLTTREKRANEIDGVDYYFVSKEEYDSKEIIQKTVFNGNYYGVSKEEIMSKEGSDLLWVIAPESLNQVEKFCQDHDCPLTKIFITNPSEVLLKRLIERYKNDKNANPSSYMKRVESMVEIEKKWVNDANNKIVDYNVIINKFDQSNTNEVILNILNEVAKKSSDFFLSNLKAGIKQNIKF
jgi:guanylate kinase